MDSFNPTTKTQAALTAALQAASAAGNPEIRPAHLLMALLTQTDGIAGAAARGGRRRPGDDPHRGPAPGRPAADEQRRDLAAAAVA